MKLVIGAPAWDRAWSLPLWFRSVRANVNPTDTGLVFVVPSTDSATRDVIAAESAGFGWVEVLRDRGPQSSRLERPGTQHRTLATARNQILKVVERVKPQGYLSWDTDFLVPPGAVAKALAQRVPLVTVWAWLNRQEPRKLRWRPAKGHPSVDVLYQDPVCATAMRTFRGFPYHYPSAEFAMRSHGLWPTEIALAWQLMDPRAYRMAQYLPHTAGEDVPFNLQLAARGIPRFCLGDVMGVHLYDRARRDEIGLGWPGVLSLADQQPLAAMIRTPRPPEYEAFGFYVPEAVEEARRAA